jgi:DNA repair exonuclease SbcCD ATPase subunit
MKDLAELANYLPHLAVIAAIFGFIGWSLHKLAARPATEKSSPAKAPATAEKGRLERVKNLETSLEKSKAAQKALKAELEELRGQSVPMADFENTVAELDTARKSLETEGKRLSTLEGDLKKSQETIKHLNARANEADKAQKDRSFALENELSKVREQLAVFQNSPDDSKELQAEIERLRESVAVSTRYAGEMRKREAAAVEALEKSEAKLADLSDPSRPVAAISKKVGPVVDSGRIAAAKAEVIRLIEMNKQKEAAVAADPVEEIPQPVTEEAPPAVEEVPVARHDAADAGKAAPPAELFALE